MCELREREREANLNVQGWETEKDVRKTMRDYFCKVFKSNLRSMHDALLNLNLKYTNSLIQTLHENTLSLLSWLVDVSAGYIGEFAVL